MECLSEIHQQSQTRHALLITIKHQYIKKIVLVLISALTLLSTQACAQRKITSDLNFQKAVEAYYDDDDDDKALELVNKQLDDTPDHLDARFLRA